MKHFKLDKRPTTTPQVWSTASASFSTAHYFAPSYRVESPAKHQQREGLPGEHWYFTSGHKRKDMFDLADECMAEWRRFIGSLPDQ